jgi:hypothetical protein
MFLDDKLYECVIHTKIDSPDDFVNLINALYKMCEDHFKPELLAHKPDNYREARVVIDRVFKSWDLMVARLKKDGYFLFDMLEKYAYRNEYLDNKELKAIYEKGK